MLSHLWISAAYRQHSWLYVFYPLGWLFALIVRLRRYAYQKGFLSQETLSIPVVVVGNITLGGSGKTPFIIHLAQLLQKQGYHVGVVSRGYGARITKPKQVGPEDTPETVGDEPCLIYQKTQLPVVVCPDRLLAARYLQAHNKVDFILSDDGMQHYRLGRTLEIALMDSSRGLGNGQCLPAGPLREPKSRLQHVDCVIEQGSDKAFQIHCGHIYPFGNPNELQPLNSLAGQKVHAFAGIGNPERFFEQLTDAGLNVIKHPLPDHGKITPNDLENLSDYPILMTEKDAVKFKPAGLKNAVWVAGVDTSLSPEVEQQLIKKISEG